MNIEITWKGGGRTIDVPAPDESAVMAEAGKALLEVEEFPNCIKVECGAGTAEFAAVKRGTFVDADGHDRPSIHCSCSYWNMHLPESRYRNAVLTCVNARKSRDTGRSANNYKRYDLVPVNDPGGTTRYVDAYYGRLDSFLPGCENGPYGKRKVQQPYKPYMYWMIYYEKISKGYVDNTAQYCGPAKAGKGRTSAEQGTPATPSEKLYAKLMSFSRQLVQSTFAAPVDEAVTQAQVKKARKYFNAMCQRKTVEGFNRQLEQLVMLSPRNVAYTSSLFAYDRDDFAAIIDREETLLNAMEAVLTGMESGSGEAAKLPSFADFGMDVFLATDEQKRHVMDRLSDSLKPKVKAVYRVINKSHRERFENYLKDNGIKAVREFWHGSRNENWLSIAKNGLALSPAAVITGKMLGKGIYFAPSAMKSWGYTSYSGSFWAGGKDHTAFMGLYATAYGSPYVVDSPYKLRQYSGADMRTLHSDCVHAKQSCGLRNDEICFYSESAMLLNYIVEFGD